MGTKDAFLRRNAGKNIAGSFNTYGASQYDVTTGTIQFQINAAGTSVCVALPSGSRPCLTAQDDLKTISMPGNSFNGATKVATVRLHPSGVIYTEEGDVFYCTGYKSGHYLSTAWIDQDRINVSAGVGTSYAYADYYDANGNNCN